MKYKGEKIPLKELIIGVHKLTLHRIPWTSFSLHCPECGGRMKSEYLDMEIDHMIYKCEKCGKWKKLVR